MQFQSAPGFLAGRNKLAITARIEAHKFQSAPGFLAGRNERASPLFIRQVVVSIRSRLFGREKLLIDDELVIVDLFQSAPGFLAGRNRSRQKIHPR